MAALKDMAVSRSALLNFNPLEIQIKEGLNARDMTAPENEEHIKFLMASIRQNGFLQSEPLEIFQEGNTVYVSHGHCRLTAVKRLIDEGLEIPVVPCVPEGRGVNDVDRFLRQNTANSGKRLTMLEEGVNVKRAISLGLPKAEVAKRTSKSLSYIEQLLDFQEAPAEVHQLVKEGKVAPTFAAETMRERPEDGAQILHDAVAKAQAEGKAKATKKHSILHEPKGKAAEPPAATKTTTQVSPAANEAPPKPKVSRDDVKLLLSECRDAFAEHGIEDLLSARCDKMIRDMGG